MTSAPQPVFVCCVFVFIIVIIMIIIVVVGDAAAEPEFNVPTPASGGINLVSLAVRTASVLTLARSFARSFAGGCTHRRRVFVAVHDMLAGCGRHHSRCV